MKSQVLFAVLAVVAVYVNAAVFDPVEVNDSVAVFESEVADEPGALVEPRDVNDPGAVFQFGPVDDGDKPRDISARNRLLFSNTYRRNAIANAVQVQTTTVRFTANTRITSVRIAEIGATQFVSAHIIDGGINRNFVTFRLTSARGRGYNVNVQIYGN